MKTLAPLAIACFATATLAAPPATEDPFAASFQRMLTHTPTPTARIDLIELRKFGDDPLQAAVNARLWQAETDWHHVSPRLASSGRVTTRR
jgi:hypothetical protein